MAALPAEALGFDDRHALQTDFLKGFLHIVELERFDDRFDFLHAWFSPAAGLRFHPCV